MRDALRGTVIEAWKKHGRPRWDVVETLRYTKVADEQLDRSGKNPAPAFRRARLQGDKYYMSVWVSGCRFPWLRGRRAPRENVLVARPGAAMAIAAATDQEGQLAEAMAQLDALKTPLYVTQLGRPRAVLMKYEDYQTLLEKLDDLEDALAIQQALQRPEGESVTLDEYESQRASRVSR